MGQKIYPYLIEEQKMNGYYEFLLKNEFKLKFFDKKKNLELYKFFLPGIRNLVFWTYNVTTDNANGASQKEFNSMHNDLKAAVCRNYYCNIFEKGKNRIVCFKNGICFAITNDKKIVDKIKEYKANLELQDINLRDDDTYNLEADMENNEALLYLYIIQLYKMIFLNKVQKEIQIPSKFDRVRNDYVRFVEQLYNIRATDNKEANEQCEKWEKDLELDKIYINVDNEFDLLYKNNRLNENNTLKKVCILVCVAAIIVGIINLWGML